MDVISIKQGRCKKMVTYLNFKPPEKGYSNILFYILLFKIKFTLFYYKQSIK